MMTKRYKPLENPQGVGDVYKGNKKLAKVKYELATEREVTTTHAFNGTQELEGLKYGTGSIQTLEGEINLLDITEMLVLHMADGRKVKFLIDNGDVNAGRFLIQLSGDFY